MSWFKKNSYVTVQVPGSKQLFFRGSWLSSSLLCKSSIHKAIKQRWGMHFHSIRWLGERRLLLYFQSKVKMMLICSPVIRSLTQNRNLLSLSWCSLACALMSWFIYNPTLIDHLIIFSSKLSVFFSCNYNIVYNKHLKICFSNSFADSSEKLSNHTYPLIFCCDT